tara:strand:- start:34562 stop:34858 length:297 start_codon:yes stop_codon:yes gene_type:complete
MKSNKRWHPIVGDELMVTANATMFKGRSRFSGNVDINVQEFEEFYFAHPDGQVVLDNQKDIITTWSVQRVHDAMNDGRRHLHAKGRPTPFFLILSKEL